MQCELCSAQVFWAVFNSWLICNKQTIKESKGHMCAWFCLHQSKLCLNCDFTLCITLVCCNPLLSVVLILRKHKVVISCSIMWPAILIFGYCPVHTWLSQHLICVLSLAGLVLPFQSGAFYNTVYTTARRQIWPCWSHVFWSFWYMG
jgi:hypothetical protein